jgi:hypothetical protein
MPKTGIHAVIRHIELGEQHFQRGRDEGNNDLFSDVIYRANQAFEGSLRESYSILAGKNPSKKKAFELEAYFAKENIFKERVTDLFTNYRTKWRNPSTHDHLALFTESEAFLAILSVTSFAGVLIDQMIERLVFDHEKKRLSKQTKTLNKEFAKHANEPFLVRLTITLQHFVSQKTIGTVHSEMELLANLKAFLSSVMPSLISVQEPKLNDNQGLIRPDFLISEDNHKAVVEIKLFQRWRQSIEQTGKDQIRRYMSASDAEVGILLLVPAKKMADVKEVSAITMTTQLEDGRYFIIIRGGTKPDYMNQNA